MTTIALIFSTAALLLGVVVVGAQLELFQLVKMLQEHADLNDTSQTLRLPGAVGSAPSHHGLPSELDSTWQTLLFVSPRCRTCHSIIERLHSSIPPGLKVIVVGSTGDLSREWLEDYSIDFTEVLVDAGDAISRSLGLEETPSALRVRSGVIAGAMTVPSHRALVAILDEEAAAHEEALSS